MLKRPGSCLYNLYNIYIYIYVVDSQRCFLWKLGVGSWADMRLILEKNDGMKFREVIRKAFMLLTSSSSKVVQ